MRNALFPVTEGEVLRLVQIASGTSITEIPLVDEMYVFVRDKETGQKDSDGNVRMFVTVVSGTGSLIQVGTQAFVGTTAAVVFPVAYSSPPVVTTSLERTAGGVQAHQISVAATTTGFTARRTSGAGTAVLNWFAMGAG